MTDEERLKEGLQEALGFHRAGLFAEARRHYLALLERFPRHPDVIELFGVLNHQEGHLDAALAYLQKAIHYAPEIPFYYNNLGETLRQLGRLEEAQAVYQKALSLDPSSVEAGNNLALTLQAQGDLDGAIARFQQTIQLAPQAQLFDNLGHAFRALGRREEAIAAYRRALELEPERGESWLAICSARRFEDVRDPELLHVQALYENTQNRLQKAYLGFALVQALEQCKAHERAFDVALVANALWKSFHPFDAEAHAQAVDRLIERATPDLLCHARLDRCDLPVLIVGSPRSGTTAVEQILSCHPMVYGAGELPELDRLAHQLPLEADAAELAGGASAYLKALTRGAANGVKRITDKMPANLFHLGLICRMFPEARVIRVKRNLLDTGASLFMNHFARGNEFASDLSDIGAWLLDLERMWAHWKEVLPLRIFELDYETLVQDFEPTVRKLLEFLQLPWCEDCLKFDQNPRAVQTASAFQVRTPLYNRSIGRWRFYGERLKPLADALHLEWE